MTVKNIKEWLIEQPIEGFDIYTVIRTIGDNLIEMHNKEIFDKRINISENISILLYRDGAVEVHISIESVLSTYEYFDNPEYHSLSNYDRFISISSCKISR